MGKQSGSVQNFQVIVNLLQIDGLINEMLFWPKLLFFKGISKALCELVLYVFLEGTKSSFTVMGKSPSSN